MNAATLFEGVCAAERHAGGIRCRRLFHVAPAYFDELRAEVQGLCRRERPSDVTQPQHVTYWTRPYGEVLQFSLLNATGRYDDFSADHDLSCLGKRFHQAPEYPALARFIQAFPHTVNFRVNVLGPGAGLSPHAEHALFRTRMGTLAARLRFHLPLVTNPRAEVMLDGHVYHLESATVYFVHHGCVHSARNPGEEARIHLAWDMLLTEEAFACMFGDDTPHAPLARVAEERQAPAPLRTERVGASRHLPAGISTDEVLSLGFAPLQ
jgi:hypothetical protein